MGVAWVVELSQARSVRSVELAFEQSGAVPNGQFTVNCLVYKGNPNMPINNTYLLQHSNFPASSFVITQSQNYPHRGTDPTATADRGFDLIIAKFLAAELLKESTKFEVDGNEYRLKDFRFRVGRAVIDKISKGIVVEIEYMPSNVIQQCHTLLQEAVEYFFPGHSRQKPAVFVRQPMLDNYMPIDTLSQYVDLFSSMQTKPENRD